MIQKTELRPGNEIIGGDGIWLTVDEILYDGRLFSYANNGEVTIKVEIKNPQPIALTRDLLSECGLIARRGGGTDIYEWHIGTNPVTHDWLFCLTEFRGKCIFYKNGYHQLQYFHQLQNLYFALTGEELNRQS